MSLGEGLNRRPGLQTIDTQGPRRAVFDPDAAGVIPGGAGFMIITAALLLCACFLVLFR